MGIGRDFGFSSDKANKPKKERGLKEISWHQCQCSGSSQTPSQENLNDYYKFLSLYNVMRDFDRTKLVIYDTENRITEVKILNSEAFLDENTSITQLPNGELFCYGNKWSGITLIIDINYNPRMLPSGVRCHWSSALYFNNNIFCFGGYNNGKIFDLSRKFDLEKNLWITLSKLPKASCFCHSVIFNGNILISGYDCMDLWLYSIELDSFSIISYVFAKHTRKVLINVEMLYLIEWGYSGLIYESEDEYHWMPVSKSKQLYAGNQLYCLYNKEKVYISISNHYFQFDLKKKLCKKLKIK